MKSYARHMLAIALILLLSVSVALVAQSAAQAQGSAFSQEEIDQMLAPIALYPDSLLSQVLMAATYPLEVGEAARWSRANPELKGSQAVTAVEQKNWDPSVKSLVAFPQILMMMDEKIDWTERLGDAFLGQQPQVMDTIQYLRRRAQDVGNLASSEQTRVVREGEAIVLEPASPDVVYVPYYDPAVIYGPWWWPAYPPVYWAPWPGYYFINQFAWGAGITIGTSFFFGAIDWPHRHAIVHVPRVREPHRPFPIDRGRGAGAPWDTWRHEPWHRMGVPYREMILRQQTSPANVLPEARREFRGHEHAAPEGRGGTQQKPGAPAAAPGIGAPSAQPSTPPAAPAIEGRSRPAPLGGPDAARPFPAGRPHVFEGIGQGGAVRDFSRRGHASSQATVPSSQPESARVPRMHPPDAVPAPQPGPRAAPPAGQAHEHGKRKAPPGQAHEHGKRKAPPATQ